MIKEKKGEGVYNVVVIGAGTAGLVTSAGTAGLGGRVALIERNLMGDDCLNFGCVPFNLSNYFYGLTAVRFWSYVLASWIGMMPGTFLYVYIGTAGKAAVAAAAEGEAVRHGCQYWTFMGVGLTATIVVTIWVTKIARNALRKTQAAP